MPRERRSFFEKLTGSVKIDKDEEIKINENGPDLVAWNDDKDAELTVDVYQTSENIIIKAFIAGVSPEDLDVNITREMVTISGNRKEEKVVKQEDYFMRELYWGSFSRTVTLPQEVDVDEAEAIQKHGLLIITLPKLNKNRQTKLKIKAS